ncbi:hypothetical protein NVP1112O_39 [Vibrio phage 1.112.O._10N.286.46.B11]|nr:hypothetical protein NVP1112O_39 [Vibrio phage 1.112.O._10N.286.46.B11]
MKITTKYEVELSEGALLKFKRFSRKSHVYISHLVSSTTGGSLSSPLSNGELSEIHIQAMSYECVKLLIDQCTLCIENPEEMSKITDEHPSLVWDIVITIVNKNLKG